MTRADTLVPYDLRLTRLDRRGFASTQAPGGLQVRVAGAVVGDLVRVEAVQRTAGSLRAQRWQLLEAAPDRRDPPCSHAQACGGCRLLPLTPQAQHRQKLQRIHESFEAVVAGPALREPRFHPPPTSFDYRRRLRLRFDDNGQPVLHNPDKGWQCMVLSPDLRKHMDQLRSAARADPSLFREVLHGELRAADLDGRAGLCLTLDPASEPTTSASRLRQKLPPELAVACVPGAEPSPLQRWALIEGRWHWVPIDGFLQINDGVNRQLLRVLRDLIQQAGATTMVDAYAGAGNLSLAIAEPEHEVWAFDVHQPSMVALRRSAREQNLHVHTLAGDGVEMSERLQAEGVAADLVIANPPRAGLRASAAPLAGLARRHFALVSCDPAALAKDVTTLRAHGFALESLDVFDMFPQTHHVETLAWLSRV